MGGLLFLKTQHALKLAYQSYIIKNHFNSNEIPITMVPVPAPVPIKIAKTSKHDEKKIVVTNPAMYTDGLFWPHTKEHKELRKSYKRVFKALNIIRDFVMRDFVEYWFRPGVSGTDKKFMGHVKVLIDGMFNILVQRIMVTANWTNFVIDRVITPLQHLLSLYSSILDDMEHNDANFRRLKQSEQFCIVFNIFTLHTVYFLSCVYVCICVFVYLCLKCLSAY